LSKTQLTFHHGIEVLYTWF